MTRREQAQLAKAVMTYLGTMSLKRVAGLVSRVTPPPRLDTYPPVTVFLTSSNNRYPLELTLRTLAAATTYPNYQIVVGDNESEDGSVELLRRLQQELPLTVISGRKPQSEWYDEIYRTIDSTYWIGIHEDLVFFGRDWLTDLIAAMQRDPALWLVEGEWFPPRPGFVEPVSHKTIDLQESLSTWLFCIRTELREQLPDVSFAFYKERLEGSENMQCWDIGGKVLRDMKAAGLRYQVMPWWFRLKWHHLANLSWVSQHDTGSVHSRFKRFQRDDTRRRVSRKWPRTDELVSIASPDSPERASVVR